MYESFYKLKENPFSLTPDPQFLYLSSIHKRAIAYIQYALQENKGFLVITGEIGAGKTTVIKAIMNQFQENAKIAHITNPSPNPHQLLRMIAEEYEISQIPDAECPQSSSTADLVKMIHGYLLQHYAAGSKVVLIIDEAQRLSSQSMEEIRLLSNLETEKDKLIHIILVGQPELRNLLSSPQLKQLNQRVSLWFHILPLSYEETTEYIRHRMSKAGSSRNPFSRQSVKCIYRASGGIPRVINIACDAALLAGYGEQKQRIKAGLVKKALDELNLKTEEKEDSNKFNIFKPWKSPAGRAAKAAAPLSQSHRVPEREELELLSHTVNSLFQKYRQRIEESEEMPKQYCFPDDLSSLKDQKFEDTIILAQIISLSQAIDGLLKRIAGE
jgi:general secretion pathway protein A